MERSISPDSIQMIKAAQSAGVTLAWDRYEAQLPQCGFGETGLCCRHCLQGPCRIDPFGVTGPKLGICGANADTIVARGLARSIAGGTASHSAHAKHLVHTLLKWSRGDAPDYGIKDHDKFYAVLGRVGISRDGKSDLELAGELARLALAEFSEREEPPVWLKTTITPLRMKKLEGLGLVPPGLDSGVAEVMHRTTNGVDADPVNVLLGAIKGGGAITPISLIGLTDFHGQLEQTTTTIDGRAVTVGGAAQLATLFDQEAAALPGQALLLASGDNVGASPANSGLLQDMPAIDVENAWGLDATSLGNHEFDYGQDRLQAHVERADFPFLAVNVIEDATGELPDYLQPSKVFMYGDIPVGVIGAELESTPELVSAGATAGLTFLPEAEAIAAESARLKALGVRVQVVVIHQGATVGNNRVDGIGASTWDGPIVAIAQALQDSSVDLIFAGHTHRIANFTVGRIPIAEGLNAGASYSVAQLMVQGGDVTWVGAATRLAKNLGVAHRADVKAIVDAANAETAILRNQVIGTQSIDIRRAPSRLFESAMGNMVADAMRLKYPGVDAAYTNSGGLRQDLLMVPPTAGEQPGEITWGEMFSVLPFGNRTVIETLTGAQLEQAFINGFTPFCFPAFPGGTGRFPQVSGLKVTFACNGNTPVVTGMWKTPQGISGPQIPIGPTDPVRFVTNDFMYTGGDGYAVFTQGTDVLQPGDGLLEVSIDYVAANSPVAPVVEGRIVGP